ncbi:AP endonuclease [Auricularia subglabra TFB-10046 SS5]|uniref:Apurinic-apyrimidinic endonuclease 1 n=1 Tax=Auricularia subglabra (strain TFB-10046 / SS5) TaxID=717982 RepID=J0WSE3_AURST|nr:AP endonuclease [Auricularia subglabra TFB-10046 SS5]
MARSGSDTDNDAPARKRLKTEASLVPSRMGSTILMESQSQDVDMTGNGGARPRRTASKRANLKEESSAEEQDDDEPKAKPKRAARGKKAAPVATDDGDAAPTPKKRAGRAKKAAADEAPLPVRVQSAWKVGAHVSAAGGVENAVLNAARIGAGAFALFLKSQRKWVSPPLQQANADAFTAAMKAHGYAPEHVLPHGSYLLNLGNADKAKREQSYGCFLDDLKRCEQLGLLLYNFHPGSTVGACTVAEACGTIAASLNRAHKETARVVTVLENMAGQGNVVGSRFEDLRDIIALVEDKSRVGVCLDTCHMFAAGYDIRTAEAYEKTMAEFDAVVGRQYLRGMHLNDSKGDLACKKDRHENIGLGKLGLRAFAHVMRDARARGVPLVLETPNEDDPGVWAVELGVLHELVGDAGEGVAAAASQASGVAVPAVENGDKAEETAPAAGVPVTPELTPEREKELVLRIKDAVAKANAGKKKPAKKVPAKRGRKKKDESDEDEDEE